MLYSVSVSIYWAILNITKMTGKVSVSYKGSVSWVWFHSNNYIALASKVKDWRSLHFISGSQTKSMQAWPRYALALLAGLASDLREQKSWCSPGPPEQMAQVVYLNHIASEPFVFQIRPSVPVSAPSTVWHIDSLINLKLLMTDSTQTAGWSSNHSSTRPLNPDRPATESSRIVAKAAVMQTQCRLWLPQCSLEYNEWMGTFKRASGSEWQWHSNNCIFRQMAWTEIEVRQ